MTYQIFSRNIIEVLFIFAPPKESTFSFSFTFNLKQNWSTGNSNSNDLCFNLFIKNKTLYDLFLNGLLIFPKTNLGIFLKHNHNISLSDILLTLLRMWFASHQKLLIYSMRIWIRTLKLMMFIYHYGKLVLRSMRKDWTCWWKFLWWL